MKSDVELLNEDNFMMYAIKAYEKPNYIFSEFEEEIKRIKYIKRLIKRYKFTGELKERLILNHIIILGNVFGVDHTVRMLFFKIETDDYNILKTFLLYLNYMPKLITGIKGNNIHTGDITIDMFIARKLKEI